MNRLTRWNGKKYVLPQGCGAFREIAERLAAYENTGLEPEEISRLIAEKRDIELLDAEIRNALTLLGYDLKRNTVSFTIHSDCVNRCTVYLNRRHVGIWDTIRKTFVD